MSVVRAVMGPPLSSSSSSLGKDDVGILVVVVDSSFISPGASV